MALSVDQTQRAQFIRREFGYLYASAVREGVESSIQAAVEGEHPFWTHSMEVTEEHQVCLVMDVLEWMLSKVGEEKK